MQPCAALIENFQTTNIQQVESLKIFFLVLQVTYFLQCGQMKSVKNTLKNLQHYVQSLSGRVENENEIVLSQNPLENFQWLNKDHLGILVYLLTIVHSVQTGSYEKAQKLIEKAMVNIQKCKLKEQTLNSQSFTTYNSSFITNAFHYMFLENMIRCNITVGNRSQAIRQIGDLFQICDTDSRLMNSFSPQLHCLVGIYCLSMNLKEQALSHFNHSLKSTLDTDLWLFNAMNSAICYLNSMSSNHNIKNQLLTIMENLMPENIQTQNSALTAVSHFFRALRFYLNGNYQQAKYIFIKKSIDIT
jgi:MAternally-affected-uncoordination protein